MSLLVTYGKQRWVFCSMEVCWTRLLSPVLWSDTFGDKQGMTKPLLLCWDKVPCNWKYSITTILTRKFKYFQDKADASFKKEREINRAGIYLNFWLYIYWSFNFILFSSHSMFVTSRRNTKAGIKVLYYPIRWSLDSLFSHRFNGPTAVGLSN